MDIGQIHGNNIGIMTPFKKLWRGEHSLSRAFWLYFALGQFFLAPVSFVLLYIPIFFLAHALDAPDLRYPPMGILFLLGVAYSVVAMAGVWRSANAYAGNASEAGVRYPLLPAAAKLVILFAAIGLTIFVGNRAMMIAQLLTY